MPVQFPQETYRLIPALYPHLAEMLEAAELTATEFFALSYVKNKGKDIGNGEVVLPIAILREVLMKTGAYESSSGAMGFVTHLQNSKAYLGHYRLTPEQKGTYFPDAPGYRDAVFVTEDGVKKLNAMNAQVERLFADVVKDLPASIVNPALKTFARVVGRVVAKLDALAAQRHRPTVD